MHNVKFSKKCFCFFLTGFQSTFITLIKYTHIIKLTMKYTCIYLTTAFLLTTKGTDAADGWGSTGISSGSCISEYSTHTIDGVSGTCAWGRKLLRNVLINSSFLKLINTFLILTHSCFTGICFHFQLEP